MLIYQLIYFFLSIGLITYLTKSKLVAFYFNDKNDEEPHKVHTSSVSRSGGIVFLLLGLTYFTIPLPHFDIIFYMYLFLLIGLAEDFFKNINANKRFILILITSFVCVLDLKFTVDHVQIPYIDYYLENYPIISILFTTLALSVAINSYNLIDGFNGLVLGISLIGFSIICIVISIESGSSHYTSTSETNFNINLIYYIIISIFSILIFNFPFGKIFTGDGGAYAIGYLIGIISIMEFNNLDISAWFFAIVLCYPMIELFFSFCRRLFVYRKHAFSADLKHLHSMIFIILSNSKNNFLQKSANYMTSIIIWIFYLIQVLPLIKIYEIDIFLKLQFLFCVVLYLLSFYLINFYLKNIVSKR